MVILGGNKNPLEDLKNYVISLESVLANQTAKKYLCNYMLANHNEEIAQFLTAYDDYLNEKKKNSASVAVKGKEIIDRFIKSASNLELNLSSGSRNEAYENYEREYNKDRSSISSDSTSSSDGESTKSGTSSNSNESRKERIAKDVFFCVYIEVFNMIQNDVMPRFIRSDTFTKMLKKNSNMLSEIGVNKDVMSLYKMDVTDDVFKRAVVLDEDFKFYRHLLTDSFEWELLGQNDERKGDKSQYYRPMTYYRLMSSPFINSDYFKGIRPSKMECYLEAPFEACAYKLFNCKNIEKYDDSYDKFTTLELIPPETLAKRYPDVKMKEKRACALIHNYHKAGPKNLDECVVISADYDPSGPSLMFVLKASTPDCPYIDPTIVPKMGSDMFIGYYTYYIEKISDRVTRYVNCGAAKIPGLMGNFIPTLLRKRIGFLEKGLTTTMNQITEEEKKNPSIMFDPKDPWHFVFRQAFDNHSSKQTVTTQEKK